MDEGCACRSRERGPRRLFQGLAISPARAVLFDFDGTLARTMEDNYMAWRAAMAEYGLAIQPEDYYPLEGMGLHEVAKRIFGKYGLATPDVAEVVGKKEKFYLQRGRFMFYPGVEALVEGLRARGVRLGVVTAALAERLRRSVPGDFFARFDGVVTGDELGEGKPSPAPYLLGARKLGAAPQDCIVVENAPLGIESAKAAGAYCIAVCTTLDRSYLKGADEICDTFEDVARSARIRELLEVNLPVRDHGTRQPKI